MTGHIAFHEWTALHWFGLFFFVFGGAMACAWAAAAWRFWRGLDLMESGVPALRAGVVAGLAWLVVSTAILAMGWL